MIYVFYAGWLLAAFFASAKDSKIQSSVMSVTLSQSDLLSVYIEEVVICDTVSDTVLIAFTLPILCFTMFETGFSNPAPATCRLSANRAFRRLEAFLLDRSKVFTFPLTMCVAGQLFN